MKAFLLQPFLIIVFRQIAYWPAQSTATVIIQQGIDHLQEITALFKRFRSDDEPCVIIPSGRRSLFAHIGNVMELTSRQEVSREALIIIGNAVNIFRKIISALLFLQTCRSLTVISFTFSMTNDKLEKAFRLFDEYNSNDPTQEESNGKPYPKELLYALRMTERLNKFAPEAAEYVHLAARCQHIGRWEIPRNSYPMDRKGYLQWRNVLKQHHADVAGKLLQECNYDQHTIDIVKFLLLKKQLHANPDTQLLEDIVCLVFVEHYLDDFASKHPDEKVIDILKKTFKKMSPRAIQEAGALIHTQRVKELVESAAG